MNNKNLPIIAAAVIAIALILFLLTSGGVGTRDTFRRVATRPATEESIFTQGAHKLFCPRPSSLRFDGTHWRAPGGWKTIDKPLTTQVGAFKKAQWQGVNLGEVICQYNGRKPGDFPINLQRLAGKIVLEPRGSDWRSDSKTVKTCVSNLVINCPFYEIKEKENKNFPELYKELFG